jgi:hypothetical protein
VRTGVSVTSYADTATFAAVTGSFDANYLVANLGDLFQPSKVGRVTPAGGLIVITAVLPVAQLIQMVALIQHTLPAGATIRVRFYSDAGMTSVVTGGDLGPTAIPAPVSNFRQTFPAVMAAPQTVRAIRVDIASAGSSAIDIGGLDVGAWWELPKLTGTAEIGFVDGGSTSTCSAAGPTGAKKNTL